MEIPGISNSGSFGPSGSSIAGNTDVSKDEFLVLLVAQLKNQSPMNPMEGHEFIAQLAQFSSLEQLITINETSTAMFENQQLLAGSNLVGKTATYLDPSTGLFEEGKIEGIQIEGNTISAIINNQVVPPANIIELREGNVEPIKP